MRCDVEWRRISRPSSDAFVMIATLASWSIGRPRSTSLPSTVAATAALARPLPIDAATSPAVDPDGRSFVEPSGSVIVTFAASLMIERGYRWPLPGLGTLPGARSSSGIRGDRHREADAEQLAQLPEHVGRGLVRSARQDRVGELAERLERARGVEVVVDRGPHPLRVRRRVGPARALRGRDEAVQQRVAVLDVGVVPLE